MYVSKKIVSLCVVAALLFTALFAGCARRKEEAPEAAAYERTDGTGSVSSKEAPLPQTHTYSGFTEEEGERYNEIAENYGAAAVQMAVLDGNDIKTFCWGYADKAERRPVTDDTKYRVASLSKLVVASTVMTAAERGYINVNEDISVYFGEECRNPSYSDTVITPSMVMTHTSSLNTSGDSVYYSGLLSSRRSYLRSMPGTQYVYSNFGYCLLPCMLERVTGAAFNDLVKEYLFSPLGIDASYVYNELEDTSDVGVLYGSGGLSIEELSSFHSRGLGEDLTLGAGNLIISAKDYVKLLGLLTHEGKDVDGEAVLSAETVEEMLTSRVSESGFDVAYGSQIQTDVIEGQTVYVHTGSAYGMYSAYVFDPVSKRAVVVLTTGEERLADDNGVYALCLELIREVWNSGMAGKT